jgi:outer membrane protein TolC
VRATLPLLAALIVRPAGVAAQAPLTMSDFVRGVMARNERAAIADQELLASEARLRQARSAFFPELKVTGRFRHAPERIGRDLMTGAATTARPADRLNGTAEGSLKIFDATSHPLYAAAKLEIAAQRLESAEARRHLAFVASDSFLVALGAEQALAVSERRVELARRTLEDAALRRVAALVGENDVTKAELELATAERDAARARAEATHTRLALANLLGAPVDGALVAPPELDMAGEPPERLLGRAVRLRSDAEAGRLRAGVAERLAAVPLLRAVPTLKLVGRYDRSTHDEYFGRGSDWSIGADLEWVLYDGGLRYGERDERLALERIAVLSARATERTVELDVRRAQVDVDAARTARAKAEAAAGAARKNAQEVAALYREGLATALDVADAGARAYSAELAAVGERYAQSRSVLRLREALGVEPGGREGMR